MARRRKHIPHPISRRQKILRLVIHLFAWMGIAVLYYFAFYLFFDTPFEYELRKSTFKLEKEYARLEARYDTIQRVLNNVVERDRNVFRTMFESDPYNENEFYEQIRQETFNSLTSKSNRDLGEMFFFKLNHFDKRSAETEREMKNMAEQIKLDMEGKSRSNYIPSIQPITNKTLTSLAASFGMRVQPFYKSMTMHSGVDYAAPIGTRVYATADGVVTESGQRKKGSSGISITIDHGKNGYKTFYGHLSKTTVNNGARVKRGDIIGLTGNSGLSFAPHLHYEVIYKGMRIDPINYFFKELSPEEYRKIKNVAASGMQSLD